MHTSFTLSAFLQWEKFSDNLPHQSNTFDNSLSYIGKFNTSKMFFWVLKIPLLSLLCGVGINILSVAGDGGEIFDQSSNCPSGWVKNPSTSDNICYKLKFYPEDGTNRGQCVDACSSLGATQLCIMDSTQNSFVSSGLSTGDLMWLGYFREANTGLPFGWFSGCSSTFTNWGSSMPDGGLCKYSCAMAHFVTVIFREK